MGMVKQYSMLSKKEKQTVYTKTMNLLAKGVHRSVYYNPPRRVVWNSVTKKFDCVE
jgi:hypothetical protein